MIFMLQEKNIATFVDEYSALSIAMHKNPFEKKRFKDKAKYRLWHPI